MRYNAAVLLLLLAITASCQGQSWPKRKNDSVAILVKRYMNERSEDSLYALTGDNFRKQITHEVFNGIAEKNLFPLGTIKEDSFVKITGNVSMYKTVFTSATVSMIIGLDSADKLETFAFTPYKDESAKKAGPILSNNPLSTAMDKAVDSVALSYMRQMPTVGLSIGILRDCKTAFYGYGETIKGNGKTPGPETIFEIGSITKTFTATMLGIAIGEGKIKLDDPVNKYLPDSIPLLQFNGKTATIRTLSNHTSGIPRMPENFNQTAKNPKDPYATYTTKDLYSFLHSLKLGREPGSEFEYSNAGVGLLGTILQKIYGRTYEELLRSLVANPLGMTNTRVNIRAADSAHFASGYDDNGVYNGPWNLSPAFAGAGAIRSTAPDMLKYAAAEIGDPAVPKQLEKAMALTQAVTFEKGTRIGLGWIYLRSGENEIQFHNGGTGGYRSYLGIDRKNKIAVVLLSNSAVGVDDEGARLMAWLEKQ